MEYHNGICNSFKYAKTTTHAIEMKYTHSRTSHYVDCCPRIFIRILCGTILYLWKQNSIIILTYSIKKLFGDNGRHSYKSESTPAHTQSTLWQNWIQNPLISAITLKLTCFSKMWKLLQEYLKLPELSQLFHQYPCFNLYVF